MDAGKQTAFELRVTPLTDRAVEITALGELDKASVDELRAHLLDHPGGEPGRILLNLSKLELIDSAGMALLLLARIEIEARGGSFVVQTCEPAVRRALRAAGIGRFVTLAEDRTAALAALAALA